MVRILFDEQPQAAHRNPWNVHAKEVIFADAAAPDPPATSLQYTPPPPDSSDDEEPGNPKRANEVGRHARANVKRLEGLMRSVSKGVEPSATERSLSSPIFVSGRPHPRLRQGMRVRDVNHGLGGSLIGWIHAGKHFGVVEGGLETSRGNGARVVFDREHPDMLEQSPELAAILANRATR